MSDVPPLEKLARREHRSRLLAWLAARLGDVAKAEDALAEAFARAVPAWRRSVPDNPEGWLLRAAERVAIDGMRRARTRAKTRDELAVIAPTRAEPANVDGRIVDKRLELLFVCAHPAIDAGIRVPLMLQTVAGVEAARIGALYLTTPATMAQRLVRAKKKIAAAGIPFERPVPAELDVRAGEVLDAVYAIFTLGRAEQDGDDALPGALRSEALWLSELLVELLPERAEVLGLRALLLFIAARVPTTEDSTDAPYRPLDEQDVARWHRPSIDTAEALLHRAAARRVPGRYQIEAAIQSAHVARVRGAPVDHAAIVRLYDALLEVSPSLGARVARIAAIARSGEEENAWQVLASLDTNQVKRYQPYWATRAFVAARSGRTASALEAYATATSLCMDPTIRAWLDARRRELLS